MIWPANLRDLVLPAVLLVSSIAFGVCIFRYADAQLPRLRPAPIFAVEFPAPEWVKIVVPDRRDIYLKRSAVTGMASFDTGESVDTKHAALYIEFAGSSFRVDCEDQATADRLALDIIRGPVDEQHDSDRKSGD